MSFDDDAAPERERYLADLRSFKRHKDAITQLEGAENTVPIMSLRIEALRAAATVMAGREHESSESMLSLAEQFVRWLETGER